MLLKTPGEPQFLLTDKQRVWGTAMGMVKWLRDGDRGILAHELYLLGEANFIRLMHSTERPDSLAAGLTDAQLGEVYTHICAYVEMLARKGATLRKRKDWRG